MRNIDTKVGGLENLEKLLKQLPNNVEKRVLQSAVTSAVREGRKEIKKSAPIGDERSPNSQRYGRLRQNLKIKRLKRVAKNERASRVDTGRAFWALFYELGTRHQPARPFFARAFRRAEPAMIRKLSERLKIGIDREVKKLK